MAIKSVIQSFVNFLKVPAPLRQAFTQDSVEKNEISMRVICAIIMVAEFYRMAQMLLRPESGLTKQSSKVYFAMYCFLLIVAILWLLLQRPMRRTSWAMRWRLQYTVVAMIFLWHIMLNLLELHQNPNAGVTTFTTVLLGISVFIQMSGPYSIALFGVGYLLFRIFAAAYLTGHEVINVTITCVVAIAVSVTRSYHICVNLQQRIQIQQINEKLKALVRTDPLTGLLNKVTLEYRADQYLQQVEKTGGVTLFIVDLDFFKSVNDHYGHPCGDHVLLSTADRLRTVFSKSDGVGRIGGDEFAVIYARPLAQEQALSLGRQIIGELAEITWEGKTLAVGCSVGITSCTCTGVSYERFYTETDNMLYYAKREGKGQCCFCSLTSPAFSDDRKIVCSKPESNQPA